MFFENDWLRMPASAKARYPARILEENGFIILTNGLAERKFTLSPDFACISIKNLSSDEQYLRSVKPEISLAIDGTEYSVGGVTGQFEHAFLKEEWLSTFVKSEGFNYAGHRTIPITRNFSPKNTRRCSGGEFPPKGIALEVQFVSPKAVLNGIEVFITYECYDGIPAFSKSFRIDNHSGRKIRLDRFECEILALTEHYSGDTCNIKTSFLAHNIFYTSDIENVVTPTFEYTVDREYTSQVDYEGNYPALLHSRPPVGPGLIIDDCESFSSYRAYLMLFDSTDKDRRVLQVSRFYSLLAPWTTQNPIYVHIISDKPETIKDAVDQCVETGFEMIIISFGSDLDMEDESEENINKYKELADYAHSRGIELGGYSLLASRHIDSENDVVNDNPIFLHSPCLGSKWGIEYFRKIKNFLEKTGFDNLEHDGSYPGDICHSHNHPGHEGYDDSQYTQLVAITEFYKWCREQGIYLTVPDFYFLSGNNKTSMGYKEVNWSLPREQQRVIARQNIYDGTYSKLPSMGWMFVPLTEYHGGGERATIEPLCEHLPHYRTMLTNNLLAGVQASYRGKRIYDTAETRDMVKKEISFYKNHRDILESPFIHLRRPDGRDYDGFLHVNPAGDEKGMLVLFNPTKKELRGKIRVPLYYTGIEDTAIVLFADGTSEQIHLNCDYSVEIPYCILPEDSFYCILLQKK